ncbi:MAG: hypothetical protein MUF25_24755, partial [Pirellulaceae bacterium]|nr:hypothetical protein [Pirellulaceae bacterium]
MPRFISHSANAGSASESPVGQKHQQVQELFDNTDTWRQARIDLTAYAGEANLKLRFDFSTAGTMNDPTQGAIDAGFGEFSNGSRSIRSQSNQFEGFYIDDIIVGFAERGEMVTSPSPYANTNITPLATTPRTLNTDPDAYPRVLTGEYQVEVRRSYEYAGLMAEDEPDIAIFQTFDTNERHVMGQTIVAPAVVNPGTTFTIVGRWAQVFEFGTAASVAPGNIPISIGGSEDQMAVNIRNAINGVNDFGVIAILHTATSNFVDLVGAKDLLLPDPVNLTFSVTPATINEGGVGGPASTTVTVTREGDTANPMTVNVAAAANGGRVTFPASVTIPANQASATFAVTAVNDAAAQGLRTVVLGGTVTDPRYSVVSTTIDVVDDESATTTATLQIVVGGPGTETLSEGAGGGRVLGAIVMPTPPLFNTTVRLVSSDPSEAEILDTAGNPITSVTIPGITTGNLPVAYFYVHAVSDAFSDGTRNVRITAYADRYASVFDSVNVTEVAETAYNRPGDSNRDRDQGQVIIDSNSIQYSAQAGILVAPGGRTVLTDAGAVTVQNLPHPGPAINFVNLNIDRLAPGAVIQNNIIANSGQQGIYFRGTPTGTNPAGNVPFGRIVNNTIYGGATASGQGIVVNDNAAPTIMNNIIANTATAIQITGATAQTGTIVGYNLFQGNNANGTAGSSALTPAASAPLFVDSLTNNFYLAAGSLAIDSSLNRMDDRDTYFWDVKNPLGLPPSAINAPDRDVFGQQRKDDPFSDPLGGGSAVFKDRGAVDRVDFDGPYAQLIDPIDNDPAGVDRDRNATAVRLPNGLYTAFSIALADGPGDPLPPQGAGVRGSSVNAGTVILAQNGVMLAEGRDFRLGYSTTNNTLLLT